MNLFEILTPHYLILRVIDEVYNIFGLYLKVKYFLVFFINLPHITCTTSIDLAANIAN